MSSPSAIPGSPGHQRPIAPGPAMPSLRLPERAPAACRPQPPLSAESDEEDSSGAFSEPPVTSRGPPSQVQVKVVPPLPPPAQGRVPHVNPPAEELPQSRAIPAARRGVGGSAPELNQKGGGSSAPELRGAQGSSLGEADAFAADDEEQRAYASQAEAYPSYSWRDTLARFPSLLKLYPLAASSEAGHDDGSEAAGGAAGSVAGGASAGGLAGNEEYLNSVPASTNRLNEQPPPPRPASPSKGPCRERNALPPRPPGSTPPRTPARSSGSCRATPNTAAVRSRQNDDEELTAAYTEVAIAKRRLDQRERELELREANIRRGEARNNAVARQLHELRGRLNDYSQELERGVLALSEQQEALKEERRQTLELQARARRMCATAVRDEVMATKVRDWERRSWTSPVSSK